MMIFYCGGDDYLKQMPTDNEIFKNLTEFYKVNGTFPFSEEKNIIGIFRKMIHLDNYFEDIPRTKD